MFDSGAWQFELVKGTGSVVFVDAWGAGTARTVAWVSLSKSAFTIGLAVLCFLCFTRRGGVVQAILELPLFAPLAKLTFCAYLVSVSPDGRGWGWEERRGGHV